MDIKKRVCNLIKKYGTNDPFRLAEELGVLTVYADLCKIQGYLYRKRRRCIILNENLPDEVAERMVMAHELGHALLHKRGICYYIGGITLNLKDMNEVEANRFAAELMIPDEYLLDAKYCNYTIEQLSKLTGYPERLIKLRLQ